MSARCFGLMAVGWLCTAMPVRAEEVKVLELRRQHAGATTYFHVRLEPPTDLRTGTGRNVLPFWSNAPIPGSMRQPCLVPQDGTAAAVYQRRGEEWQRNFTGEPGNFPEAPRDERPGPRTGPGRSASAQVPVQGLEFIGKVKTGEKAQFLLLYPAVPMVEEKPAAQPREQPLKVIKRIWKEVPVTLDLATATRVEVPTVAAQRRVDTWPVRDDLEGLWAVAQAEQFLAWEMATSDFGFYGFARMANSRKYNVPALSGPGQGGPGGMPHEGFLDARLYETTTGATALAESLALRRLLGRGTQTEERSVPVGLLQGIDIAEHPWEKMMAGKKPVEEPLARLVPREQYYVSFKTFKSFLSTSDLFDEWGTAVTQVYEVKSREYNLKQRYEKQLCLRSTMLGRTMGPAVIRSLAFTGSDLYFREGTDLAILFDVVNDKLFLAAVEPFLAEARKEFGSNLAETKTDYQGVRIESFVTPERDVSLHRATLGTVVVYANSRVGLQRIIDAHQKKTTCLADSLDFQYMRTIFRHDDAGENGFAFFSDAFIRQLVGPASKIKERRRIEAFTSLQMLHHGALYSAWESGTMPSDVGSLMSATKLSGKELLMPEGPPAEWRGGRKLAYSPAYNTIHFLTPLCELPMDKVTPTEQREYEQFRQQYLGLWREFFDPVGMRLAQKDGRLTLDTYILPLIQSNGYAQLRRVTGEGTTTVDLRSLPPTTVAQFMTHISRNAPERQLLSSGLRTVIGRELAADWLGEWFFLRFEDSPAYAQLAQRAIQRSLAEPGENLGDDWQREIELLFQMPITLGVEIKNPIVFGTILTALRTSALNAAPDLFVWGAMEPKYKNVSIVRIQINPQGIAGNWNPNFKPSVYYALVDGGFYASFREECIKGVIDRVVAKRDSKGEKPDPAHVVELNQSLYLSPQAAAATMQVAQLWLGYQAHEHAVANTLLLQPLYQAGLLGQNASAEEQRRVAYQFYGFVPVSPDGSVYQFDPRCQEVTNAVHGSQRQSRMPEKPTELPIQKMLAEVQSLRLDLRFREDGVHTVVTLNRPAKGK